MLTQAHYIIYSQTQAEDEVVSIKRSPTKKKKRPTRSKSKKKTPES